MTLQRKSLARRMAELAEHGLLVVDDSARTARHFIALAGAELVQHGPGGD